MTSFFGYGSLVNTATHSYPNIRRATVQGWRRHWVPSNRRDVCFLSVEPHTGSTIQGLIADVAPLSWDDLDEREQAYTRARLADSEINHPNATAIQMYRADPDFVATKATGKHVLLSYLDCVVQGFLCEFGEEGVTNFFRSTTNWQVKIRNDRATPIYPRAQSLTAAETALVDAQIEEFSIEVV